MEGVVPMIDRALIVTATIGLAGVVLLGLLYAGVLTSPPTYVHPCAEDEFVQVDGSCVHIDRVTADFVQDRMRPDGSLFFTYDELGKGELGDWGDGEIFLPR